MMYRLQPRSLTSALTRGHALSGRMSSLAPPSTDNDMEMEGDDGRVFPPSPSRTGNVEGSGGLTSL